MQIRTAAGNELTQTKACKVGVRRDDGEASTQIVRLGSAEREEDDVERTIVRRE